MSTRESQTDLCFGSISELAEFIRSREVSPVEVTESILQRIDQHNESMRVYITVTGDVAMNQARQAEREIMDGTYRSPLHGITVSLKDNITTKGIRTSCATAVDPDWVPDYDATVYSKLREAGAILIGKANLFEYAFSMSPEFPPPLNPWNPERTSSGSSSGSGVGVAAGMAHGSIGSDTGGSGRSPANVNGVVGLKATYGRISCSGLVPLSYSLDHTTVMTRTIRDSALMLQAIAGPDERDENTSHVPVPNYTARLGQGLRGLRIGFARGFTYEGIDAEVESVIADALDVLRELGAAIEEVELPYVRQCAALQTAIMMPEAAVFHWERHRESADKLGETALMRLDTGAFVPATAYVQAQRVRKMMCDQFRELLQRFDVIIGPGLAMRPGNAGTWTTTLDGKEVDLREAAPEYTGIYNLTGMPALVLPAGFSSDGTPIGLQIAGKWFDEATVLKVGHAYEQATEWHRLRPPYPKAAS